jgi:hypothetical protein
LGVRDFDSRTRHWHLDPGGCLDRLPACGCVAMSLPFKISAQRKGTQKAYREFVKFYGKEEGERIFLQKAEERGEGSTIRQKCNSIYKTGAKLDEVRRSQS